MKRLAVLVLLFVLVAGPGGIAAHAATLPPATQNAPGAPSINDDQPHVFLVASVGRTELKYGEPSASSDTDKPSGLAMFIPIVPTTMKTHVQYAVKTAHASLVTDASPVFEIDVPSRLASGDPAHFTVVILRWRVDGDKRVIGAQLSPFNVRTSMNTVDPIVDERLPVTVTLVRAGRPRIAPTQPLPSGEYGVAMRDPSVGSYTYSSTGATSANAVSQQQSHQAQVWDFAVRP